MAYNLQGIVRKATLNMAVEFDFAPKWAECIGQALYYGKKPIISYTPYKLYMCYNWGV